MFGLLAFLIPFGLYLWSLAPSITFYDSGEFITAVYYLGSAHSPGYPLFLLFSKPFTWLPFGSIAFRVNLATAVSAAFACLGCYHLTAALLRRVPFSGNPVYDRYARYLAALSGALLFAVSDRLWLQSNHDKPYPLLTALVALMLLMLLRWRDEFEAGSDRPGWWYAAAFIAGLATGAHQTVVLMLPGCLLFVLMTDPSSVRRIREWLIALSFLLAGGGVQLYLPLRAAAEAKQNWGDPSSLSRFLWHLLRRGYPEEPHGRDFGLLLKQLAAFSVPHEFGLVGLLLLAVGVWNCRYTQRPFLVLALASLAAFWLVIVGHFNPQAESIFLTEEFYTPLYLIAAVIISIGLYAVTAGGVRRACLPERYSLVHRLLLAVLFLLVPLFQFSVALKKQDQHRNYLAQDYAANSLRPAPEDAVLFTWGDSGAFPLWYLQGVERLREDIDVVHIPHLAFSWYRRELPRLSAAFGQGVSGTGEELFVRLVEQLHRQRPVLMDFSTRHSLEWPEGEPVQHGIIFWPRHPDHLEPSDGGLWRLYALHRLLPQGWLADADSEKALSIHGYSLLVAAEACAGIGNRAEAGWLLQRAGKLMPQWQPRLQEIRRRYAVPEQREEQP